MTLILLGVISAAAIVVMVEANAGATSVKSLVGTVQSRSVAQAGAARAVYGALVADDPLKLFSQTNIQPRLWWFDGMAVTLSATAESDRIDLNAGRSELVEAKLARLKISDTTRAEIAEAFRGARSDGVRLPRPAALLRPCLRLGLELIKLEAAFTVATRAPGIALKSGVDANLDLVPSLAATDHEVIDSVIGIGRSPRDDQRLRHLWPYLSERSSIYRIVASAGNAKISATRHALISLAMQWPYADLLGARWVAPVSIQLCH